MRLCPAAIADSFGAFDLAGEGYRLLFEAQWIHRPAPPVGSRHLPAGWSSVSTESDLQTWTACHDTQAVLIPALLQRSAFRVIGKRQDDGYTARAVLHLGAAVVDVSNVWSTSEGLDWSEHVDAASALFPGRVLVGYGYGADLEHASAAGFPTLGPQRVWVR